MDTFIDTAWYYLRSINPDYRESIADPAGIRSWGQADLYVGGIEISVPIMLYGGFVTKALRDAGIVDFGLPCRRLLAHEMVLMGGRKMSKSLGNTVDPAELIDRVGADSVRLLTLSLAPPLKALEWSEARLQGCHRFLTRVWKLGGRLSDGPAHACQTPHQAPPAWAKRLARRTHEVVHAVTRDMERLQFNTCVTELIKFLYSLEELEIETRDRGAAVGQHEAIRRSFETLLTLLSPFSPHLCAELWSRLELPIPLSEAEWPKYDRELLAATAKPIAVKVDARVVARVEIPADTSRADALAIAYRDDAVRSYLGAASVSREIYVPGQVINFVTVRDSAVQEEQ